MQGNPNLLLMMGVVLIAFMFISGRKAKKRQKDAEEKRQNAMKVGTKVLIFNHIKGVIVNIVDTEYADVKVDKGVNLTVKMVALAVDPDNNNVVVSPETPEAPANDNSDNGSDETASN